MKKILYLFLFIIVSCSYSNKTSAKKETKPEWLTNPDKVYPNSLYLKAIGYANDYKEAENNARANIAKIFESNIEVDQQLEESYKETSSLDGNSTSSTSTSSENKIRIYSAQTLLNAQIAGSYIEGEKVYVLAYIDKVQTVEIYEEKINKNSEEIAYLLGKANSAMTIKKYAYLKKALSIIEKNETLINQLQVISSSDKDLLDINYNKVEVEDKFKQTKKEINFSINILNDENSKIATLISNKIGNLGFDIKNKDALLKISGKVEFQETNLAKNTFSYIWSLQVNVLENNNIILTTNLKNRVTALDKLTAKERAISEIDEQLNIFIKDINNYFENIEK